jgi:glycosyltransferase involved in cell wall biosynthesis
MLRVLHLIPPHPDLQTRHSARVLRESLGDEFVITTRAVHNLWAAIDLWRRRDRFDIVHAWDQQSHTAARLAGFGRIVYTPNRIRPPVSPTDGLEARRDPMRARLGLGDDQFVMLVPGESTRAAAHERAVWASSILHVTDERYRVLLWGRGPRLNIAANLGPRLRQPGLVVVAEHVLKQTVEFEDLLPAADALLVTALRPAPTLPIALATSAGVPVVGSARPEWADLLVDGVTSWNVPAAAPRMLAQRILDLRADPAAARHIASNARDRARELFDVQRFVTAYRRLYHETAAAAPNKPRLPRSSIGVMS